MVVVGQPARVGEVGVASADLAGLEVHPACEGPNAAREPLGHGHRGIVGRLEHERIGQVAQPYLLAGAQAELRGRLGGGVGAYLDVLFHLAALEGQDGGHHLGGAGRGQRHFAVALPQYVAVGRVHDQGGPRRDRRRLRHCRDRTRRSDDVQNCGRGRDPADHARKHAIHLDTTTSRRTRPDHSAR